MKPIVSVIMPVYNAEKYLGKTIESILNQTFEDFELVVVDDCSTDNTIKILREYQDARIKTYLNKMNKGVAFSRNRAIQHSEGKYIAIMDHDDIAMPMRLEKEMTFLDTHSDYGVVGGKTEIIDEQDLLIKKANVAYHNYNYINAIFLFKNVFCNSEMMFRKDIIEKYNIKYDNDCYGMEDFKFWIQMSKLTKMVMLDDVFLQHRVHKTSLTSTVFTKFQNERQQIYNELQEYSWKLSGLDIPDDVAVVIHKYLGEYDLEDEITKSEVAELYKGLQSFLNECKKLDNYVEIEQYCRKIMLQYIKKQCDFWISQEIN